MKQKINLLYIDDEVNNLNSFKAAFRMEYNILTANTTADALEILSRRDDIHIVLSDQRMPDMTGVQLFEGLFATHPLPVRMLVTGYTDISAVISAINKGHIFRYIPKPWSEFDIRAALEEGYSYYKATSMLALRDKELLSLDNEFTQDIRGPLLAITTSVDHLRAMPQNDEVKAAVNNIAASLKTLEEKLKVMHDHCRKSRTAPEAETE